MWDAQSICEAYTSKKPSLFHHGFPNINMAMESDHIVRVKKLEIRDVAKYVFLFNSFV